MWFVEDACRLSLIEEREREQRREREKEEWNESALKLCPDISKQCTLCMCKHILCGGTQMATFCGKVYRAIAVIDTAARKIRQCRGGAGELLHFS